MSTRTTRALAVVGIIVVGGSLLAAAGGVEALREQRYPGAFEEGETLYVTSGHALRRMTGAYSSLAADLYWIRTIQYLGGTKRRLVEASRLAPEPPPMLASSESTAYRELYPLLDITTSLDPRFNIAYRFGAVFLAEPYPGGPGRPDLAVALLEKGLRARPDKWEYMEDIGFVHYWYRHDYTAAAAAFSRAAQVEGAPWWLKSLAATTLAEGGDRRSSRVMWESIRQSAEVDWLRRDAERRLAQLNALDQIDALQRVVDRAGVAGRPADDWGPIVHAQGWRGRPIDPAGAPYELSDGRVQLSPSSPLWPLPEEPAHLQARPPS